MPPSTSTPDAPGSDRLGFVEVGRGLAALSVVVFHANVTAPLFGGPKWLWPSLLAHGVDFFFVLSGFVILHAHHGDISRPDRMRSYALKRAIRLLPILWIVVGGWALLRWAAGVGPDIGMVARSLLPYPSLEQTLPPVVWTLRHEMVFYVLFAALLVSRRIGIWVFAAWFCLAAAQMLAAALGRPVAGLPAFFLAGYSIDFMLGMAVYVLHRRFPARPSSVPLVAGVVMLVVIVAALGSAGVGRSAFNDYVSPGATWGAAALGGAFAGVLYGLVRLEGRARPSRALLALGASSYVLYLAHTPINSLSQIAARTLPPWLKAAGGGHLVLIVAAVALSWLLHRYCERPLMLHLRRAFGLSRAIDPPLSRPLSLLPDPQSTPTPRMR